jgi:uncharacterized protein YdcH (DUF465 family)
MTPSTATSENAAAQRKGPAAARVSARLTSCFLDTAPGPTAADGVRSSDRGDPPMFEAQPQSDVEALLENDHEFRKLYQRHRELDKQVLDAELGVRAIDDTTLVKMKKEKLQTKDRLTRLFETRHALH